MLARAFLDDPVAVWACGRVPLRLRMLEGLYSVRLAQMLPQQAIWITPERYSAALWAPPGRSRNTIRQDVARARCLLHPRLLARLPLLALGLSSIERERSQRASHWYLSLLGTDPDARGHGLGSAVLEPVLQRCDSDGVGAYLESSKERNIDFYVRHGFRVIEEIKLPRGPRMWPMWRDPSPRRNTTSA
jgi:GNAT superfamily N-acetyltransferase